MIARAEEWNSASGRELVSDDQLAIMEGMRQNAAGWADEVQRGVDAVNSMNLSQLFGQGTGGRLNEIDQAVLDQLRAQGATPEQLQAAAQQMGLNSGTMTGMSVQFGNSVVPQLAEVYNQLGPDAYLRLRTQYDQYNANMVNTNPGFTGPVPWDLIMRDAGINQQQGSAYTVQAGDTVWGLAHAQGMTTQEYMAANGLDSTMLSIGQQIGSANQYSWDPTAVLQAADSITTAADSATGITDDMTTAVDTLSAGIESVFGKTYQLPIELVVSGAGILGQLIAAVVNGNGGTTPGSSGNTGRSNAGSRNDGNQTRGR
jgi:LysM repeat protein